MRSHCGAEMTRTRAAEQHIIIPVTFQSFSQFTCLSALRLLSHQFLSQTPSLSNLQELACLFSCVVCSRLFPQKEIMATTTTSCCRLPGALTFSDTVCAAVGTVENVTFACPCGASTTACGAHFLQLAGSFVHALERRSKPLKHLYTGSFLKPQGKALVLARHAMPCIDTNCAGIMFPQDAPSFTLVTQSGALPRGQPFAQRSEEHRLQGQRCRNLPPVIEDHPALACVPEVCDGAAARLAREAAEEAARAEQVQRELAEAEQQRKAREEEERQRCEAEEAEKEALRTERRLAARAQKAKGQHRSTEVVSPSARASPPAIRVKLDTSLSACTTSTSRPSKSGDSTPGVWGRIDAAPTSAAAPPSPTQSRGNVWAKGASSLARSATAAPKRKPAPAAAPVPTVGVAPQPMNNTQATYPVSEGRRRIISSAPLPGVAEAGKPQHAKPMSMTPWARSSATARETTVLASLSSACAMQPPSPPTRSSVPVFASMKTHTDSGTGEYLVRPLPSLASLSSLQLDDDISVVDSDSDRGSDMTLPWGYTGAAPCWFTEMDTAPVTSASALYNEKVQRMPDALTASTSPEELCSEARRAIEHALRLIERAKALGRTDGANKNSTVMMCLGAVDLDVLPATKLAQLLAL